MTLTIVTSFNRAIWNNHGKTCIESWIKHIKGNTAAGTPAYSLHLYIDGPIPSDLPKGDNIHIHWLDTEPEYTRFLTETRDVTPNPHIPPEHKFRFEFRRFWPKVFSIRDAFYNNYSRWGLTTLWLDADILFKKDVSVNQLRNYDMYSESKDIVCLDRGPPWNYMDSGFLGLNVFNRHDGEDYARQFVDALYNIYTTKTIFRFTEWHDAFLMSQVMNILWGENKGTYVKSLSGMSSSLHPLDDSWLSEYLIHFKGALKAHVKDQPDLETVSHLKGNLKTHANGTTMDQSEPQSTPLLHGTARRTDTPA